MLRFFKTAFSYQGHTYTAVASVLNYAQHCRVIIYFPDVSLHHIIPGGKLTYDGQTGIQLDRDELFPAQDLLATMIMATEKWDGFPAFKIGFKTSSFPLVHPFFIQADVTLQFHINHKLKDAVQLDLTGVTDSPEVYRHIRTAMAALLQKWEDRLRGHNLFLEFYITCNASTHGIQN